MISPKLVIGTLVGIGFSSYVGSLLNVSRVEKIVLLFWLASGACRYVLLSPILVQKCKSK